MSSFFPSRLLRSDDKICIYIGKEIKITGFTASKSKGGTPFFANCSMANQLRHVNPIYERKQNLSATILWGIQKGKHAKGKLEGLSLIRK